MKNIQIFDGADNAVYDIFAATDEEFSLIFTNGTDVAFIDEVYQKQPSQTLNAAFTEIWSTQSSRSPICSPEIPSPLLALTLQFQEDILATW